MLNSLFLDHPREVGETYGEHMGIAGRFGATLVAGGLACLVHAIVPALFKTAGSDTVRSLNEKIVRRRGAMRDALLDERTCDWVI